MHGIPTRKIISQACDACRRRKIKCNGKTPCLACLASDLACIYNSGQKRGSVRGERATVLNGLRREERTEAERTEVARTEAARTPDQQVSPSEPVSSDLESITIEACINAYLARIHPVVPLLSAGILREEASQTSTSLVSRQFIVSFCAYVVTFGRVLGDLSISSSLASGPDLGQKLLDAALQIQNLDLVRKPTKQSVYISFFLYGAHAGLGNYSQGWFYLREATTFFMMQKRNRNEDWYGPGAYRCLFWVLLVSERAHGIRRNRPITLQIMPSTPTLDSPFERGLQYLASLFHPFDEAFFAVWNGARTECSQEWLLGLERDVRTALPPILDVSNEQITNLRVSQLWLQIKLWELFPRFGFLSSESVHECLTFRYPVTLARDMMILGMKVPVVSLQIHGVGMTEKIFDIACALADILPFISWSISQVELGPIDYLTQATSLLAKLPGGSEKFVPLLLAKVNELVPELVETLCAAIQMPVIAMNDPMSPDSRFMFEEEVGRGLYADLRRGR